MQLPERYWEGRYWEGLTPESLDAVPLESAGPEVAEGMPHDDDAQMIKEAIDLCKKYIAQKQEERVIDLGHLDLKRVDETSVGHDKTTNEEVDSKESAVSHYYITIQDAPLSPTDVVKLRSITSSSRWSNDIKPNLPNSSTASNNGENEGDTSSMDILSGQGKLVCLLWHYSVFLGARVRDSMFLRLPASSSVYLFPRPYNHLIRFHPYLLLMPLIGRVGSRSRPAQF